LTDPQALRAQADRILELHETGALEDALEACARLLEQVDPAELETDEVVRESAFTARFQRAVLHTELGDLEAAASAYAEAAATPTDLEDPDQRHELAMALLNHGICLEALGEVEEALGVYDRLVIRLGDAEDPVTADQVVRGRVNRAAAMLSLERHPEALTVAEGLVGDLDAGDAFHAEQLAMATRLRAVALTELGRAGEAATVLAELDAVNDEEIPARRQLAAAAGERAQLLWDLGRADEALEVLEAAQRRFGGDADEEVLEQVTGLRLVQADVLETLGDVDGARQVRSRRPA
jgi:tetratricopeptide (TPR) repeat protein